MRAFHAGGSSAWSTTAVVITPGEIPQAPSDLRTTAIANTSIGLAWLDNSVNEQRFHVQRSTDNATFALAGNSGMNVATFTDKGLTKNRRYYYRVLAFNANGTTAWSNTITVTTAK